MIIFKWNQNKVSWCIIENDHNFDQNENRVTVFLKWTDFTIPYLWLIILHSQYDINMKLINFQDKFGRWKVTIWWIKQGHSIQMMIGVWCHWAKLYWDRKIQQVSLSPIKIFYFHGSFWAFGDFQSKMWPFLQRSTKSGFFKLGRTY